MNHHISRSLSGAENTDYAVPDDGAGQQVEEDGHHGFNNFGGGGMAAAGTTWTRCSAAFLCRA